MKIVDVKVPKRTLEQLSKVFAKKKTIVEEQLEAKKELTKLEQRLEQIFAKITEKNGEADYRYDSNENRVIKFVSTEEVLMEELKDLNDRLEKLENQK